MFDWDMDASGAVKFPKEDKARVHFYKKERQAEKDGELILVEDVWAKEFVGTNTVIEYNLSEDTALVRGFKEKYAPEYEAFESNAAVPVEGTPIKQIPGISELQGRELVKHNIRAIEDFVKAGDHVLEKIPNGRKLKKQAQEYLEFLDRKKEDTRDAEIAELKKQLAALTKDMKSNEPTDNSPKRSRSSRTKGN